MYLAASLVSSSFGEAHVWLGNERSPRGGGVPRGLSRPGYHVLTDLAVNTDPIAATAKQIPKKIMSAIQSLGMCPLQLADLRNVTL